MIPDQRFLFDIPEEVTYLNCAYTAPLLKAARDAGERAVRSKSRPWEITPGHFFSTMERVRTLFARLVGCEGNDVAVVPAVSYGIALAARNLPLEKGQSVLVLEDQFPSNIYSWQRLAREQKGNVRTVTRPGDRDWTRAVLAALDDDTAIVAVPHCHWTDGSLLDLVRIGKACRKRGAALVVDGIQSVGAMPFPLSEIRPDFLVAGAHKWLLGPYGYGFCYVAPKWQNGIPLEENWLNRDGSEDFSRLVDYRDAYRTGARRFDMGGGSSFFLTPVAEAALEQILEWTVPGIAETLGKKTDRIAASADRLGLDVAPREFRSPHLMGITFPDGVPQDLARRLASENIHVSVRGNAVRVAPHLYNTDADLERLERVLEKG